jgi:hypothetical protein
MAVPYKKLLALAALLKEARGIEHDLAGRLFQHPKQKSLLKQHKEYRRLVEELTCEFEGALASYLARIKAVDGPVAYTATGPSGRSAAACRSAWRRPPAR